MGFSCEIIIKERLDCLDQPYVFGTKTEKESTGIFVKTAPEHMGKTVMDWIAAGSSLEIRTGFDSISVCEPKVEIGKEDDGSYFVSVSSLNEEENKKLERWFSDGENRTDLKKELYLGGSVICSADGSSIYQNGSIRFDYVHAFEAETITDENLWVAKLLESVANMDRRNMFSLYRERFALDTARPGGNKTVSFGISDQSYSEKIRLQIKNACPEVESVGFDGNEITVVADVPIMDGFPEEFIERVKEIYQASDFENIGYGVLLIGVDEEDANNGERARFLFSKQYRELDYYDMYQEPVSDTDYDDEDEYDDEDDDLDWSFLDEEDLMPGIRCQGAFHGGRIDQYIDAFKKQKEKDLFFASFIEGEDAWNYGVQD